MEKLMSLSWKEEFLTNSNTKRYDAKSIIIHEGETSQSLYYIISGSVSVILEDDTGHKVILAYLNKDQFFGEMGLFDENTQRSAKVIARTECDLAELTYEEFKKLAKKDLSVIFTLASQLTSRLKKTTAKVKDLAFLDVTGRIAHTLLELCKEPDAITHPDGMQIKITRQEIARLVSCSREMAGRVLKELEEQGLITAHGKTTVVFGTR